MTKEEAIKIVKDLYNKSLFLKKDKEAVRTLIPEVEESEDERIRKALIKYYSFDKDGGSHALDNITPKQIVAWLEKQGEQKLNPVLDIEIPFGARDSELLEESIAIPKGCYVTIEGNRVVIKKGEQKPNYCHHEVDLSGCSEEYRKAYYDGWNNCNQQHAQLDAEQKSVWSEEDENKVTLFMQLVEGCDNEEELADWLKFLKERVQPKQEWNYNDEITIETIIQEIEKIPSEKFIDNAKYRCLDWLRYRIKSFRPQNRWKPSDEQIQILHWSIPLWIESKPKAILESLINDLKKLMEE